MDRQALWTRLVEKHQNRAPRSRAHSQEASRFQIRGGSHNLRLFEPFPFFDEQCSGSKVVDLDGNVYVDFWQGHYTNGAPAPRPLVPHQGLLFFRVIDPSPILHSQHPPLSS